MKVAYRRLRLKEYQAIITDEQGNRWVWLEPILKREAEYQGPHGLLSSPHKTTAYDITGYGTVPSTLELDTGISNYIKEHFLEHPEEFDPFYSLTRLSKSQRKYITRRN